MALFVFNHAIDIFHPLDLLDGSRMEAKAVIFKIITGMTLEITFRTAIEEESSEVTNAPRIRIGHACKTEISWKIIYESSWYHCFHFLLVSDKIAFIHRDSSPRRSAFVEHVGSSLRWTIKSSQVQDDMWQKMHV